MLRIIPHIFVLTALFRIFVSQSNKWEYWSAYNELLYHHPTRCRATTIVTRLRWLHLLAEVEQGHFPSPLHGDAQSTKCKCYFSLSDHTLTLGTQSHNHSADGKRKAADQPLSATQNLISENQLGYPFQAWFIVDCSTELCHPTHTYTHLAPPSLPHGNAGFNGKQYRYLLIYVRTTAEKLNHQLGLKVEITCRLRRMFW